MDSTAIATTMPPGRYDARHIAQRIGGFMRSHYMLQSGMCLRRTIGPADAMVITVAVV